MTAPEVHPHQLRIDALRALVTVLEHDVDGVLGQMHGGSLHGWRSSGTWADATAAGRAIAASADATWIPSASPWVGGSHASIGDVQMPGDGESIAVWVPLAGMTADELDRHRENHRGDLVPAGLPGAAS